MKVDRGRELAAQGIKVVRAFGMVELPALSLNSSMEFCVPAVEKMLPKLDSIMTSQNAILADPAIRQSLHNVQTITDNLTTSTAQFNTLMAGLHKNVPSMMAKANNVLDNTETVIYFLFV